MNKEKLLLELSSRQKEAVEYSNGPLLIVAGPGSGKTRVIAHKIAYLNKIKKIPLNGILAVTFTNKAAKELRERCQNLLNLSEDFYLDVKTFHSFCSRVLRFDGELVNVKNNYVIYDYDDQSRIMKKILKELDIDSKQVSSSLILGIISDAKNRMLSAKNFSEHVDSYIEEIASRCYEKYEEFLVRSNSLDFDDLLLRCLNLFQSNNYILDKYQNFYKYFLIDEFQDTNPLQFEIAKILANRSKNICVVGDPDQSIYSWRHANPKNLLDFEKYFKKTKIITLDQSYRSTKKIIKAADSVIGYNDERLERNLWTDNPDGEPIELLESFNDEQEADSVISNIKKLNLSLNKVAIMYRVNSQSRSFEVACNRENINYKLIGSVKFYERKEIKDILSFLRVISNPADNISLERIINLPARGISSKTFSTLSNLAENKNTSILELIFQICEEQKFDLLTKNNISQRAINSINNFSEIIKSLVISSKKEKISDFIDTILDLTGYGEFIEEDLEKGEERIENILELKSSALEFSTENFDNDLVDFLENISLVTDLENNLSAEEVEGITLITLHQAKGLEFDAVFLVGLEEGLLPHSRSLDDPNDIQEERRLLYVGITRAKERLFLSRSRNRKFRGQYGPQLSSRFLSEIPNELLKISSQNFKESNNPYSMYVRKKLLVEKNDISNKYSHNFLVADKVFHKKFGEGVIISIDEKSTDYEVTIAFNDQGVKRLMLSYAKLEKISIIEENIDDDFIKDEYYEEEI